MSTNVEHGDLSEKHATTAPAYDAPAVGVHKGEGHFDSDPENLVEGGDNVLHKDLKGRHMQMIAM
jgi:hypothetical protein